VAVLEQDPAAGLEGGVDEAARVDLLALAHADRLEVDALALGARVDGGAGVGAHGEEADEGREGLGLLDHAVDVEQHAVHVPLADRVGDVALGLGQRAVGTPGPGKS